MTHPPLVCARERCRIGEAEEAGGLAYCQFFVCSLLIPIDDRGADDRTRGERADRRIERRKECAVADRADAMVRGIGEEQIAIVVDGDTDRLSAAIRSRAPGFPSLKCRFDWQDRARDWKDPVNDCTTPRRYMW